MIIMIITTILIIILIIVIIIIIIGNTPARARSGDGAARRLPEMCRMCVERYILA